MGVGGTKVLADTQRLGRHRQAPPERLSAPRRHRAKLATAIAAVGVAVAIIVALAVGIALYHDSAQPYRAAAGQSAVLVRFLPRGICGRCP